MQLAIRELGSRRQGFGVQKDPDNYLPAALIGTYSSMHIGRGDTFAILVGNAGGTRFQALGTGPDLGAQRPTSWDQRHSELQLR
jgi:hypothetical protein